MTGPCTRIRTFLLVLYPGKHLIEIKASFPREAWHHGSKSEKQTNIQSVSLSAESVCFWKNMNPPHQFLYGKKEEHLAPTCPTLHSAYTADRNKSPVSSCSTDINPTNTSGLPKRPGLCVCTTIHTSHHLHS